MNVPQMYQIKSVKCIQAVVVNMEVEFTGAVGTGRLVLPTSIDFNPSIDK